jgi:hypothetical protein
MSQKLPRTLQAVPDTLHARLEIADAIRELLSTELCKAGFNPGEPRVPAGNPQGGQWTTDGSNGSWLDVLFDWFRHTSDPEWAEAQRVQDLVENHPRAAIISGSVGLAIPFAAAGAFALPELLGVGAAAEGPAATLELAQGIANVESYPMRFRRTIALLETAEGPMLVAGGGTDLSAAQIAMARQLGLTPVTGVGEHAELTAIAGARSLGLTPTAGVTTIHICPSCAVKIYNMGGWLTVARRFAFGR